MSIKSFVSGSENLKYKPINPKKDAIKNGILQLKELFIPNLFINIATYTAKKAPETTEATIMPPACPLLAILLCSSIYNAAPGPSPPTKNPCDNLSINKRIGAAIPIAWYPGKTAIKINSANEN